MRRALRILSRITFWVLPILVCLILLISAFLAWCAASSSGTRWLVHTAVSQLGGEVHGIRGTLSRGLYIGDLALSVSDVEIQLQGAHLNVLWSELLDRRLHVNDLSVQRLAVAVTTSEKPESEPSGPVKVPALPVAVQVDNLSLDGLAVTMNGEPLPADLLSLAASLKLEDGRAAVSLNNVRAAYDDALLTLNGRAKLNRLEAPWPFELSLRAQADSRSEDSPVCVRGWMPAEFLGHEGDAVDKTVPVAAQSQQAAAGKPARSEQVEQPRQANPPEQVESPKKASPSGQVERPKKANPSAHAEHSKKADPLEHAERPKGPDSPQHPEQLKPAGHLENEAGSGQPPAAPEADTGIPRPVVGDACQLGLSITAAGDLDAIRVRASGGGQQFDLVADSTVYPQRPFPVGATMLRLSGPGGKGLDLNVTPGEPDDAGMRRVRATLAVRHLILDPWLPDSVGATRLNLAAQLDVGLSPSWQIQDAGMTLAFQGPNQWNGQALSGNIALERLARTDGPLYDPDSADPFDIWGLVATGTQIDVKLGPDQVAAKGKIAAADSQLSVLADVPSLKALWPGLPGSGRLKLDTGGSLQQHQLTLDARYVPDNAEDDVPGRAPIRLKFALKGAWDAQQGWSGSVERLDVDHAKASVHSAQPVPVALTPQGEWSVGAATVDVGLSGERLLQIRHEASGGDKEKWHTRGRIDPLVVTPDRIDRLRRWLALDKEKEGGVHTALSDQARRSRLEARLSWNLQFADTLTGDIRLARTGGDLVVPGDIPIQLGLQQADLDIHFNQKAQHTSVVAADLQVDTEKMGRMRVRADTLLHATESGGLALDPKDEKHVRIEAVSEDLAWVNLFLGGALEVGGTIHADVQGRSRPDGTWTFSGPLSGEGLKILSLDQGIRLLDGTLQAHADGGRIVLDHLRFPAELRVEPKEWRTATWIKEDPDAQDGYLDLSGQWDLYGQEGAVHVKLHRYPILQRSDRYAMISGDIKVAATLPSITVDGKIVADAGWFDLDMLNNIPSLDGDVVVLKPGQKKVEETASAPLDMIVDLAVDLGPRFYITGYGLDSGLIGQLNLHMQEGKLTGVGALHTRGGAINAYGQHLQLWRGNITFQRDITNPVLDIEALRTDVQVKAGVRVAGTARHPRIDLISYPDVSQTEKLTWLLLGHGPDEGGGDMSLLFSVGTSFLSGGEPFYKRFGLDELSLRSGELGSTGSVLPAESVVRGLDSGSSPIEQRFVRASKSLSKDVTLSLEQALAQTGTVARLSYRLVRGLQAELTVGTVSGLALVYRWFSMD